ncbi:hypothetical protein [Rhizobium skierniewicense]|uniref:hypothetical protein n=1 Tax=Rhizobium skierniewicense TaxID=984260 RepID=UPI00157181E4|nr:hypothetical protein [Rhizobium skierniewicense]NTF34251.1 hypothetical protein [Rhizobium skierniewicense]
MDKVKRIDNIEELVPELMRIRNWLLPALEVDPSGKDEFDIVCELENRLAYLYVAEQAFTIVSFHKDAERGDFCCYRYTGGESHKSLQVILDHQYMIEDWARNLGFKYMVALGRAGWGRALKPYGFVKTPQEDNANVFVKTL